VIGENGEKKAVTLHTVWVCPGCGKTVHAGRRYCDCHADLASARARLTEKPPESGPLNFETSRISCDDCPENCAWCAGFGDLVTNKRGFGGKDCRHNNGAARCYCCQAQVKIGLIINEKSIFEIMGTITTETLKTMADVIQDEMEKPVLARIRHRRESSEFPREFGTQAV
jgi:hypothetical protein